MTTATHSEPTRRGRFEGDDLSLVDALDRLMECGVCIQGDVVLSVAGVDLVWLGLRAALGSIEHAPPGAVLDHRLRSVPDEARHVGRARDGASAQPSLGSLDGGDRHARSSRASASGRERVDFDGDRAEQGLVRLVLSIVELLRQLMERQAIRRTEDPEFPDEVAERLGVALMRLSDRMDDLKEFFGLSDEDLELSLGHSHALG